MADLKDLTVPLLDKLARECRIKFNSADKKKDKITKIQEANIDPIRLQALINKYAKRKKLKKITSDQFSELKGRIKLLEEQVKFLMSKISFSEIELLEEDNRNVITISSDLGDIKRFITSIISPGESISIDELIEIKQLQKIPLITLKHVIYDLIDENVFEPIEGNSRQKIGNKIGMLKRI
jgi:tetrahydromethanopterin S-methyltransferase subunit G